MPTYDYRCEECDYTFEHFQAMFDEPLTECPKCGCPVRRLMGAGSGVIFKGSGFYVTDNKKSDASKPKSESSAQQQVAETD